MEEANGARVRWHQLRLYVDNHQHDRYLAPPLTVVVAALLTLWVPVWQALLWAGVELVVIAVYVSVCLRFRCAPAEEGRWARRIALAHGAHMAMWSSIVVWAYQPGDLSSLMFVMLVHVGLISLTVVMSNPHRRLLLSDLVTPTVSIGVAITEDAAESLSSLMRRSDRAMYAAKAEGRNQVVIAPPLAV